MRSIERTLLAWILGALSLGAVLVALVSYLVTLQEMHEAFDAHLRVVAEGVASYHRALALPPGAQPPPAVVPPDEAPQDTDILTATWTPDGRRLHISDPRVPMPFIAIEGLTRPTIGGEQWIVYTDVSTQGVAQAAQRLSARREMAAESAAAILPPLLGLIVVVGGLLYLGLRRGLEPLARTARDVAARSVHSLEPIPAGNAPRELVPLVASINQLMARLDDAFKAQRRFLADAAHELRTPVTALRLQHQLLDRTVDAASRRAAMQALGAGIDRAQRLIEQLLQVSRAAPDGEALRPQHVDLDGLVAEVVAALSPKAERFGIDLGAGPPSGASVEGDRGQLGVLLGNLVDNALRYTPDGGLVDASAELQHGIATLIVTDNGPGIPEHERERVFDRFHRGADAPRQARDAEGSGLGLAIVRAIAARHRAEVSLATAPSGQGLQVIVRFLPGDAAVAGDAT